MWQMRLKWAQIATEIVSECPIGTPTEVTIIMEMIYTEKFVWNQLIHKNLIIKKWLLIE